MVNYLWNVFFYFKVKSVLNSYCMIACIIGISAQKVFEKISEIFRKSLKISETHFYIGTRGINSHICSIKGETLLIYY
jgi:hypothetical protein